VLASRNCSGRPTSVTNIINFLQSAEILSTYHCAFESGGWGSESLRPRQILKGPFRLHR
jgi:hypothetical protein